MDVFIADGVDETREALNGLIADLGGISVVGMARDTYGVIDGFLLRARRHFPPAVLILSVQLADGSSLGVLQFIRRRYPATKIIMLCDGAPAMYQGSQSGYGADYFFDKANDFPAVLNVLCELSGADGVSDCGEAA